MLLTNRQKEPLKRRKTILTLGVLVALLTATLPTLPDWHPTKKDLTSNITVERSQKFLAATFTHLLTSLRHAVNQD